MLFNSINFLIFFPIVLAIYFVIPAKVRYIWLLVCSYYFYMSWNAKYAILIAISTLITYASGLLIHRAETVSLKKIWVALSFISNIGILVFFKYFYFLTDSLNFLLGRFGLSVIEVPFSIVLPVGISFYTFQALSYTMDVYRGEVEPEYNLLKYALFVSFFPQLVAGPIERSKNLIAQVKECHTFKLWQGERIADGLSLMLWGYFLKMVVADRLAIFVTKAYDNYMFYGSCELIVATVFFAFQIYCDFASYSIIAVGAAKIMGFDLMENFNTPYLSKNVAEFWRRWHISLSTWFRDYLYFPMGGSRCSKLRSYFNLMVTFLVSGMWHGADVRYLVWGLLHGIYQVIERATKGIRHKVCEFFRVRTDNFSHGLFQTVITFVLVDFAWIFFRADSMESAINIIVRMFTKWNPWIFFDESIYRVGLSRREFGIALFAIFVLILHDLLKRFIREDVLSWFKEQGYIFRGLMYIAGIVLILVFGIYGPNFNPPQFVYFQF